MNRRNTIIGGGRRLPRFPSRQSIPAMLAVLLIAAHTGAWGQGWPNTGADAVESFNPGTGSGHGMEHFPGNVLGLPDSTGSVEYGTVDPAQVLSLGSGGEIVLRFDRHIILDRPGPDFIIFENAFRTVIGGKEKTFVDPGEVSVSRNGVDFIPFPFDTLTLQGCAGVTPTNGTMNPGDPTVSGGDSFDIGKLGLDSVRYIRIRDKTAMLAANQQHPFWDVTHNCVGTRVNCGFDLDAIVVVTTPEWHPSGVGDREHLMTGVSIAPNPFAASSWVRLNLRHSAHLALRVLDPLGREVARLADGAANGGTHRYRFDAGDLPDGVYFIAVEIDGRLVETLRTLLYR